MRKARAGLHKPSLDRSYSRLVSGGMLLAFTPA
jgi:hypothetical protein